MGVLLGSLVHLVVLVVMPPLLVGVIAKTKAWFAGRVGAPLLQPYHDLLKLFRKSTVTSRTTTWVFAAGPVVAAVTALLAGTLVPTVAGKAPLAFSGDLVLFAYLLALGRFFTAAAALDTGSAFEGMGAAREVSFSCLAEPAMFLCLLALVRLSGSLSISGMLSSPLAGLWISQGAALLLVLAVLGILLLAENSRIPFDDPNTHLELTMIHEVMVLDHSGPAFGLVLYGAAMKLFVLAAMLVRLALPVGHRPIWLALPLFCAGMLLLAILIGVVESIMARLRLTQVPNLLIAACLLAGFGFLLAVKGP